MVDVWKWLVDRYASTRQIFDDKFPGDFRLNKFLKRKKERRTHKSSGCLIRVSDTFYGVRHLLFRQRRLYQGVRHFQQIWVSDTLLLGVRHFSIMQHNK